MKKFFSHAMITEKGGRDINEDSIGVCSVGSSNCYVICDGLGGHGMGDVASSIAVDVIIDEFKKNGFDKHFFNESFMAAENILMTEQIARHAQQKMKTTAVVLVTDGKRAHLCHVGDSRIYVFNNNEIIFRTLDHSVPQMMVMSGIINESQIRNHSDRNLLLRVLGIEWDKPMYEISPSLSLKKCQAFLLCSDGFWELIEETEMCALLHSSATVAEWLNKMTDVVKENGKNKSADNFSAIAVWCN